MAKNLLKKKQTQRKKYTDLVGIDFASTATKVVRLKRSGSDVSLMGLDLLPAVDFGAASSRLELPRNMVSHYGCLCYSSPAAVVRVLNTPLPADAENLSDAKLRELLSIKEEFRAASKLIRRGTGRQDSSLLAAAIPQDDANFMLNMFPSGPPAPASLEVSGLAMISAFLHSRGSECADDAVCLIEAGESTSTFVFMNKGKVLLVGKPEFGGRVLRQKLASDLGVDDELATSILNDRSINISASLSSVLTPFTKQISISKDFVERQQGCRVKKVYLSGGLSMLPSWADEVSQMLHTDVVKWSPLEEIQYVSGILDEETEAQATRFTAAIGAALGGFEES